MGENMDEILKITKKYKQHPQFEHYVNGFKKYYEEVFNLLPASKKSLDIGCAYGILALMLKRRGDDVTASDMVSKYTSIKMLEDYKIKFAFLNIEKEDVKGKFDLITMTETIEHLNSNPLPAIKRLYNALNPGGHLFVSTVMKEVHGETTSMNTGQKGLWNDLNSWKDIPEYKGKWVDEHTYHYTQFDLVTLLSDAGFEIEDLGNIGNFSHWIIGVKNVNKSKV
jgi:2-polyprenyl-3-methyl-5-hydroxy-6-metoxy-1,4-benzoquinol methylase